MATDDAASTPQHEQGNHQESLPLDRAYEALEIPNGAAHHLGRWL